MGTHRPPSAVFAERLRSVRKRRGLTQEALARRLEGWGAKMDRATIARIEGGSRTVSIDDAFAIAAALDVSPIHLLTPTTGEQDMHPAPTTTRSPAQARRWVLATRPLPGQDEVTFRHEEDLHQVTETEWALGPLSEEDRQVVEAAARSAHDFMLNELDRAMRTRQQRDAHAHDTENTEG